MVILLAVIAGLWAICLLPFRAHDLVPASSQWEVTGSFEQDAVYFTTRFDRSISARDGRGLALWGSWCGSDANTGELQSPPFKAPSLLEIFLAGYPEKPGLKIFLQRENTQDRLPLSVRADLSPGEQWRAFHWWVPARFRGQSVRLVAVDYATGSGGWLGISTPRRISMLGLLHRQFEPAIHILLVFIFDFVLFVLPGFALASAIGASHPLKNALHVIILIVATGATLGYAAFWSFFFSKLLGKVFVVAVYTTSASIFILALCRKWPLKETARQVAAPFIYAGLAGACYLCFFFLFTNPVTSGAGHADQRFFQQIRPGDNLIPLIFADKIYYHQPLRPFCCGDWLSSDRPPLQSGIVLLERPFHLIRNSDLDYELLTVALQCLWICGVWCLLNSLGTSRTRIRQALGFLVFSGFFFYNSVYTWPKLLAAACILFVLSIVFDTVRQKQPIAYWETILAAACLGLALVAHPSSVFSLAAFSIIIFRYRGLFPIRNAIAALAILFAYILPWSAYQKFVDPPGNRLIKMHIAGEFDIDSRSALQGIVDAYRRHTLSDILHFKWTNIQLLGGRKPLDTFGLGDFMTRDGIHLDRAATERSRIAQREWIWNAVGVLNAGWIAWLLLLFRSKRQELPIPFAGWLIAAALVNFTFWALITFGPWETVTTHSSYSDILLLSIGLLGFVLTLPAFVSLSLLALQIFNLSVVWIWSFPQNLSVSDGLLASALQWPLVILGALMAMVLLSMFYARTSLLKKYRRGGTL